MRDRVSRANPTSQIHPLAEFIKVKPLIDSRKISSRNTNQGENIRKQKNFEEFRRVYHGNSVTYSSMVRSRHEELRPHIIEPGISSITPHVQKKKKTVTFLREEQPVKTVKVSMPRYGAKNAVLCLSKNEIKKHEKGKQFVKQLEKIEHTKDKDEIDIASTQIAQIKQLIKTKINIKPEEVTVQPKLASKKLTIPTWNCRAASTEKISKTSKVLSTLNTLNERLQRLQEKYFNKPPMHYKSIHDIGVQNSLEVLYQNDNFPTIDAIMNPEVTKSPSATSNLLQSKQKSTDLRRIVMAEFEKSKPKEERRVKIFTHTFPTELNTEDTASDEMSPKPETNCMDEKQIVPAKVEIPYRAKMNSIQEKVLKSDYLAKELNLNPIDMYGLGSMNHETHLFNSSALFPNNQSSKKQIERDRKLYSNINLALKNSLYTIDK